MPVGIFDDEGERLAETLVEVVYLLVAVAACNGAHLEEADAQYCVVRKVDDKLADERRCPERERESLRFAAGGIGEVIVRHALYDGCAHGFGAVIADIGDGAAIAVRCFERHAPEQLIGARVFKTRAADGHIGQRAERDGAERDAGIARRELVLPFAAGLTLVGDGG